MNRYALASTLPPSCIHAAQQACLVYSAPDDSAKRDLDLGEWTELILLRITRVLFRNRRGEKKSYLFSFTARVCESTPPLLFLRPLRGTWSVSQKSRFYRPISRGAGSLRVPTRAHAPARVYVYRCTHAHVRTLARACARAHTCLGRMEPPTRHHHLYRLHARRRERRFAERSALRERAKTKRDCVPPPRLRVPSHSLRCSRIADDRPSCTNFRRGRERERE